jgi:hypothetical protein
MKIWPIPAIEYFTFFHRIISFSKKPLLDGMERLMYDIADSNNESGLILDGLKAL